MNKKNEKVKIVLLPLDERPCNYDFPKKLFDGEKVTVLRPDHLGDRKDPADPDKIYDFLMRSCTDADVLILSLDMFLYGGLLPSRLHHRKEDDLKKRLRLLRSLRKKYPKLPVYAFQCIMRCPDYSSSEEEPDYYEICGKEIRDYGVALHKYSLGKRDEQDSDPDEAGKRIPRDVLNDYMCRRDCNLKLNLYALKLVKEGVIDELVIPQDDCSEYGFSAMDREKVTKEVDRMGLKERVMTYPGADEAGLTLIARYLNRRRSEPPRCYVRYISECSKELIPLYEGQTLEKTVNAHLKSAGCVLAGEPDQADFVLALTGPTSDMLESEDQFLKKCADPQERSLPELIRFIKECREKHIPVTIGDNAYANGGDLTLIRLLNEHHLLYDLAGYAGWNTNANTLGTAIAEAAAYLYYGGQEIQHWTFLTERYLEDAGYCAKVRKEAMDKVEAEGGNVCDISSVSEEMTQFIRDGLDRFLSEELSSIAPHGMLEKVSLPWKRLFEVDLSAKLSRFSFCIDIGGTAIKYGCLDEETMQLEGCGQIPTPVGGDAILKALLWITEELENRFSKPCAICISSAGMIDSENGVVLEANEDLMPDYTGTEIRAFLEKHVYCEVHVENDVNCAALAEYYAGAARGASSSLTLTLGTGIGGAIIYDGKLFIGHTFSAGEVGYMHMDGGSFEQLAATSALTTRVEERLGKAKGTLNGKLIFELADEGDEVCRQEIAFMCDTLSKGIANLCYVLNPQVVVIGGGISARKDYLQPLIEKGLDTWLIPAIRAGVSLRFADCGNQAGMLGAYFAWKGLRSR